MPKKKTCADCGGKRIHTTYRGAIEAALFASAKHGGALRIYDCPHGRGMHLTTKKAYFPERMKKRP